MSGPLDGIVVADFSRVIAGPFCTQTLADLGARVIKIEHPTGDDTRGFRPPEIGGESTFFMAYNRNKQGIVLDLAKPEGLAVARDLVAHADVLVENFSFDVMAKFGLDYDNARKLNPRIIYVAGSAYGREGPFKDRAGYDPAVQAESGYMSVTGFPDREPFRTGVPMIDITTGLGLGQACLAALIARERTGEGQYVEVGLWDTAVAMTFHFGMQYLIDGKTPGRHGNGSPAGGPIGVFQAKDGPFQMTIAGDRVWRKLCLDVLERPDLVDHPDYATNPARLANLPALRAIIEEIFRTETRDTWVERMRRAKVPAGPIRTIAEACESDEVKARGLWTRVAHPTAGTAPVLRNPIRFSDTPVREPAPAPTLGQHTEAVLRELLGYDEARIGRIRASGALG